MKKRSIIITLLMIILSLTLGSCSMLSLTKELFDIISDANDVYHDRNDETLLTGDDHAPKNSESIEKTTDEDDIIEPEKEPQVDESVSTDTYDDRPSTDAVTSEETDPKISVTADIVVDAVDFDREVVPLFD